MPDPIQQLSQPGSCEHDLVVLHQAPIRRVGVVCPVMKYQSPGLTTLAFVKRMPTNTARDCCTDSLAHC